MDKMTRKYFRKKTLIAILIAVLLMVFMTACEKERQNTSSTDAESAIEATGGWDAKKTEPKLQCPIDGATIEEMPIRPIAVTIDNYQSARPQSGLNQADLIYEVPVEGGITRYLAIYFHGEANIVGPIRSARPYLIELARQWDAVYIHIGQSPQAKAYFSEHNIPHINQMYHSSGFWRDKSRRAPHNLYSSTQNLWNEIVKLGWDQQIKPEGYKFRSENEILPGIPAIELTIPYQYGDISYRYNEQTSTYMRYINNNPYNDLSSDVQLSASNILIQYVSVHSFDSEGRLEISLTGSGNAILFSDGYVQKGIWKKDSVTDRTRFYDESGSEMLMKIGQTWIQLVPKQIQVKYQ